VVVAKHFDDTVFVKVLVVVERVLIVRNGCGHAVLRNRPSGTACLTIRQSAFRPTGLRGQIPDMVDIHVRQREVNDCVMPGHVACILARTQSEGKK